MATGTFGARVAHSIVGAPHLLLFSCPILYLCGFLKVVGVGSGLQRCLGSKRKAWDWPGPGHSPTVFSGRARFSPTLLPPENPVKWGSTISPSREVSLSEEGGRDAGQMVTTGHPQWVTRQVPTVRFAIRGGCWQGRRHCDEKSMI